MLILTIGALSLWAGLSDVLYRYVRPQTKPWLVLAGAALVALAVVLLVANARAVPGESDEDPNPGAHQGHDGHHSRGPGVLGWMMLLPVVVVLLLDPGSLNSAGVSRTQSYREPLLGKGSLREFLKDNSTPGQLPDLPLTVFASAAAGDEHQLLQRTPARLTGFVATDRGDGSFTIARYQIGCCAADGAPLEVEVQGLSGPPPPVDTWVQVDGTYEGREASRPSEHASGTPVPVITARSLQVVDEPEEPYEYPGRY